MSLAASVYPVETGVRTLLARSRRLDLCRAGITGPLIIPSLSSKGFPIVDGLSEVADVLVLGHTDMREAVLVSAYDLHHGYLRDVDEMFDSHTYSQTPFGTPELLVVDSGGYELSADFETGEVSRGPREPRPFTKKDYETLVDRLPESANVLIVSHDAPEECRPSYSEQRAAAQEFFAARPQFRSNFLLKPQARERYIQPVALVPEMGNLRVFDVLGVTEKELGDSILERLVCLSRLRSMLDGEGLNKLPIHVFGGLDPLLTPLYFMCGAEIFDGLSWLKYAFQRDVAMHPDAAAVLGVHIDDRSERRSQFRHISNLRSLAQLKHKLQVWLSDPSKYEELGEHHEVLRQIYETVQAQLK